MYSHKLNLLYFIYKRRGFPISVCVVRMVYSRNIHTSLYIHIILISGRVSVQCTDFSVHTLASAYSIGQLAGGVTSMAKIQRVLTLAGATHASEYFEIIRYIALKYLGTYVWKCFLHKAIQ